LSIWGVSPEIVDVVYIAPKKVMKKLEKGRWIEETRAKYNLPDKFVVFDHGVNYNKNVPTLVKACKIAKVKLVIIGKHAQELEDYVKNYGKISGPRDLIRSIFKIPHPQNAHFKHLLDEIKKADVIRPGFVSDEDLNKIFNLANICIQPSYYEGFGMPPVEAMTVGCPVISSRTQALVEVCSDACLYFDLNSVDDLVKKIKTLVSDDGLRKEYIKKGLKRVKMFSWEKAAKETLAVYAKV